MTATEALLVVLAAAGGAFLRGFLGAALRDLWAFLRRRREPVEPLPVDLSALLDADVRWLEANGWQPPAATVRAALGSPRSSSFVLTTDQHLRYVALVREATEIRKILDLEAQVGDRDRHAKLRAELKRKADEIRAESEGWEQG